MGVIMKDTCICWMKKTIDKIAYDNLHDGSSSYDLDNNFREVLDKLLKDFNRSFPEGFTELLKRSSYDGNDTSKAKWKYVHSKLKSIGVTVDDSHRKTIQNWINGKNIPHTNNEKTNKTRDRIFQICFALSVSIDDVNWFFNRVLFERGFNCHRMEEAVYYYCLKEHCNYEHAQQLISEIQAFPEPETPNTEIVYTREIQQQLDDFNTDEELKQYFRKNKWTFRGNLVNQFAKKRINELLERIQGKKTDRKIIKNIIDGKSFEISGCGLVVRKTLNEELYVLDTLTKKERKELFKPLSRSWLSSNSITLKTILTRPESEEYMRTKEINLPEKGRQNFPSQSVYSALTKKEDNGKLGIDTSTNYESIRKYLILLQFYDFWCLNDEMNTYNKYLEYLDRINDLLVECGYDELYPENSYDCLFMLCSASEDPLGTLCNFLSL